MDDPPTPGPPLQAPRPLSLSLSRSVKKSPRYLFFCARFQMRAGVTEAIAKFTSAPENNLSLKLLLMFSLESFFFGEA